METAKTTPTARPAILGEGTLLSERPRMLVGGRWQDGAATTPVENPTTGAVLADVPEASDDDVDAAMAAAVAAQRAWARRTLPQRAEVLARVIAEIDRHAEELAWIVVAEQAKTITEARGEVQGAKSYFEVALTHKYDEVGHIFPAMEPGEHLMIRSEPLGVVVAITPWNFPAAIFARKVGPALMAGNAVVVKPSELTPLSALAMGRVCQLAGVPDGLLSVVPGQGRVVGKRLVQHPSTAMVTLTGSTRAGKEILAQTADQVIPVSLELGGKAPFIVFPDADLDLAARKAVEARFANCGQVCTCNERMYVHRTVFDAFVARFVELVRAIRVGDPADEGSQMGPKISGDEVAKVQGFVDAAVAGGAEVLVGGGPPAGEQFAAGHWFAPTVLTGVSNDMDIVQDEVFGPVVPVLPFDDFDEVMAMANSTAYGLTSYVFTQDITTANRALDALQFGEVYVNKVGPEQPQGFHSGWKSSGLGGEDGKYGFERYLRKKTAYVRYEGEYTAPQGQTSA